MHPVLFRLPFLGWPIYSYGVMLGISLIVGWFLSLGLAARDRLPREKLAACYIWTAVAALVGARVLYILTNLDRFVTFGDVFAIRQGGLVAYGGFLAGLAASWGYCRVQGIPLLAWGDCAAPALGTGLMFTRVGCFLYGCDYGKPTHVAWAVRFPGPWRMAPHGSPAFQLQLAEGLLPPHATHSLPVHPTQIYESLLGLGIFALLMLVRRVRRFSGEVLLWFGLSYGVGRFLLEYLRGDDQRGSIGIFSTSQAIGLVLVPLCLAGYYVLWQRWKGDPAAAQAWTQDVAGRLARRAEGGGAISKPSPSRAARRKRGARG